MFYLVADPIAAGLVERLNSNAVSLAGLYGDDKDRTVTYAEMVEVILAPVRDGASVCAVFYGHPGVFVDPGHEAVRRARSEGYEASMMPGISAEDCLFADLGLDPGAQGCQSYTGHDFVSRPRLFDRGTPLILWQVTAIGDPANRTTPNPRGIEVLAEILEAHYGPDHEILVYVAAVFPVGNHTVRRSRIRELHQIAMPESATVYVPPIGRAEPNPAVIQRLRLEEASSADSTSAVT